MLTDTFNTDYLDTQTNMVSLSAKKRGYMMAKLELPVAVKDILDGKDTYNDTVQYAMHDLISDMEPDNALLGMTLSVQDIAKKYSDPQSGIETHFDILNAQCEQVLNQYGGTWLLNMRGDDIDADEALNTLRAMPEDMEALAGLIAYSKTCIEKKHQDAAAMLGIFQIQLRAQSLVAEHLIEAADMVSALEVSDEAPVKAISPAVGQSMQQSAIVIHFPQPAI